MTLAGAGFSEISALLAAGYLRLTQKGQSGAVSDPPGSQKVLDVQHEQSGHVVTEKAT